MKIIENCVQGSDMWLALRESHFCASDAPIMMGDSKYKKRNDLLREKASADKPDYSESVLALFAKGHETEEAIRPFIESLIDDELFPATVVDDDDYLLASLDGMTMDGAIIFEHKLWNQDLAKQVEAKDIEPHYYWQMEQQLFVSGAEKCIFVVSDGTPEKCVYMEYTPVKGRVDKLLAGWKQLEEDLGSYQHVEVLPAPTADPVTSLPSVSVQVHGSLEVTTNLAVFGERLKEFVEGIDKKPSDDQAFANCESAIKTLKKAEEALDAAEAGALAQVACIDEMRSLKESLHELARNTRLSQEKLVKARKDSIRIEIVQGAEQAFRDHCAVINKRLEKAQLPAIKTAFAEVIKGKKTVSSLRDAVDTELAKMKIEANAIAEKIDTNLRSLREMAKDHAFLFVDTPQLVHKDNADLVNLIKLRISEHDAKEKEKLEAQREKIRQEEEAKARAEAQAAKAPEPEPEPEIEPITETPVATKPALKEAPRRTRPTDAEIIELVALHYRVHESKVIEWMLDMDLMTESEKLREAM